MTLREAAVELVCFGIRFDLKSCLLVIGLITDAMLICLRLCRVPEFQARLFAIFLASCAVFALMTTPFYLRLMGCRRRRFPVQFYTTSFFACLQFESEHLGFLTRVLLTATQVAVTAVNTIAWATLTFSVIGFFVIVWLS